MNAGPTAKPLGNYKWCIGSGSYGDFGANGRFHNANGVASGCGDPAVAKNGRYS